MRAERRALSLKQALLKLDLRSAVWEANKCRHLAELGLLAGSRKDAFFLHLE
jgi:hypothetical protein